MKHLLFTGFLGVEILLLSTLFLVGNMTVSSRQPEIAAKKKVVSELMLTDFAVWTEAHYTRNPSQADYFTPFQDFPSSIEHFPAGSIIAPGEITATTRFTRPAKSESTR